MLTIGIDYTPAYEQGGGIGRYVRDLVAALSRIDQQTTYRLFVAGAKPSALPPSPAPNFHWRPTAISPRWLARLWHRAHLPVPIETFTGNVHLYHATDFVLPPVRKKTLTLLTVHDLSFVRVPEAASPNLKAYLDRVVPQSVKRADHVLADSAATKRDLVELYKLPEEKITVLLSGVDARFKPAEEARQSAVREKYAIGTRPFIFSVGTVQPRKNYSRLIQALARLRTEHYDLQLVIAGGRGWLEDPIYETIRETRMEEHVRFIGFADEADLNALYSASACFAFPSLYEGFGLPVLEAMACGTPVVTSNVSSLPEVAGEAAVTVDPYDVEAIAGAIKRFVDDTAFYNRAVDEGFQHAQQFTWENSAKHLYAVYTRMLGDKTGISNL